MTDLIKTVLRIAKIVFFVGAVLLLINTFITPALNNASDDVPIFIQKCSTFLTVARENINMIFNPYVVDAFLWISILRPVVTLVYRFGFWIYEKITE